MKRPLSSMNVTVIKKKNLKKQAEREKAEREKNERPLPVPESK